MLRSFLSTAVLLAAVATQASADYVYQNFQSNQPGLISWVSRKGTYLSMRSYHVDGSGIRESTFNTGSTAWSTVDLGIPADGDVVAGVHKYSDEPNDVLIRIFFQNKTAVRKDRDTGETSKPISESFFTLSGNI